MTATAIRANFLGPAAPPAISRHAIPKAEDFSDTLHAQPGVATGNADAPHVREKDVGEDGGFVDPAITRSAAKLRNAEKAGSDGDDAKDGRKAGADKDGDDKDSNDQVGNALPLHVRAERTLVLAQPWQGANSGTPNPQPKREAGAGAGNSAGIHSGSLIVGKVTATSELAAAISGIGGKALTTGNQATVSQPAPASNFDQSPPTAASAIQTPTATAPLARKPPALSAAVGSLPSTDGDLQPTLAANPPANVTVTGSDGAAVSPPSTGDGAQSALNANPPAATAPMAHKPPAISAAVGSPPSTDGDLQPTLAANQPANGTVTGPDDAAANPILKDAVASRPSVPQIAAAATPMAAKAPALRNSATAPTSIQTGASAAPAVASPAGQGAFASFATTSGSSGNGQLPGGRSRSDEKTADRPAPVSAQQSTTASGDTPDMPLPTAQMIPASGASASFASAVTRGAPLDRYAAMAALASMPGAPAGAVPVQSLRIQLRPIELGTVTVNLKYVGKQLTIDVEVETPDAQRRLSSDSNDIAKSMQSLGFQVDKITVRQVQPHVQAQAQTMQRDASAGGFGGGQNNTPFSMPGHPGGNSGGRQQNAENGYEDGSERRVGAIQPAGESQSRRGVFI